MAKKQKSVKKRYVSVRLPAKNKAYPLDRYGSRRLPNYTKPYLQKHGRKLFEVLFDEVPSTVYMELVECIRKHEKI
jgi:hypothetical protein